ncbi:serine/threonine protein kinase [Clostridium saccharoperbutylacetonicum]
MEEIAILINYIDNDLLSNISIKSVRNSEPIQVKYIPVPWILLGVGNYAVVLMHPDFPKYAIKIYAVGRPGIEEEIKVYGIIKEHPAFSKCFYYTDNYLILKRLKGKTLYSCIKEGIQIPERIIKDIDEGLKYARSLGLNPHDVHAKNVMIVNNRGVVADISDFTKIDDCRHWKDFKKAYYKIYIPFIYKFHPAIPEVCLDSIRRWYRLFRKIHM